MARRNRLLVWTLLLWGGIVSWGRSETLWTGRHGRLAGINPRGVTSWFLFPEKGAENLAAGTEKGALPGGIVLGLKVGEDIHWFNDWEGSTAYAGPGHLVVVSERTDEAMALTLTVRSCFDQGGVFLQAVSLHNQGDSPLKKVHFLAHARFREDGEEAKLSLKEGMVLFPVQGGSFLASAGDEETAVVLAGSKESGPATEELALWAQGEEPSSLEGRDGQGLHFCTGWELGTLKKGEEKELTIRWACGSSEEDASESLAESLKTASQDILSLNQAAAGVPEDENVAQALALIQCLCQDSGAILSAYPPSLGVRVWDGSLASLALSGLGRHEEAVRWLDCLAGLDAGFGGWWSSYQASGDQVFLPLPSVDATGMALLAFLVEGRRDKTILEKHWERIQEATDFLSWWQTPTGIPAPSWDRETGELVTGRWSLVHAYMGLAAASEMASLIQKQEAAAYAAHAARLKVSFSEKLSKEEEALGRLAGWTGLGAQVLEGWGPQKDTWSLLWNLQRVPTGADSPPSVASLSLAVWPAGLSEALALEEGEGREGLDLLLSSLASHFSGKNDWVQLDETFLGERSFPYVKDGRLKELPSLSHAAAVCLSSLGDQMPAPAVLPEGTVPTDQPVDFVSKLREGAAQENIDLTVAENRVEMRFLLGDLLKDLPAALTQAPPPALECAKAIPSEADGLLALSLKDAQEDRKALADWLSNLAASSGGPMGGKKTEIKMAVLLLFQFVYPSLEVGFFDLTREGGAQWLVSMKLREEKKDLFPDWLQKTLTQFGAKYDKTETDVGLVLSFADGAVSLVISGETLLVTAAGQEMAQKALETLPDEEKSVVSKLPDVSDLGPLVLYIDAMRLAEQAASLERFREHAPGCVRLQSILLSPLPSEEGGKLVIRSLLGPTP